MYLHSSESSDWLGETPPMSNHNPNNTSTTRGAQYSKEDLKLKASPLPPSYQVVLPKGMDPTLSAAEQKVADRIKASLEEDPNKSDLDILREELRKIIEKMG
jgi:hypothetical protein